MTARNIQREAQVKGLPWDIAKGYDTFLPIRYPRPASPFRKKRLTLPRSSNFIPKTKIPDPHSVHLYLNVNGDVRQSDSTGLMLFRIPRLLSAISNVMTLEKGDIVLTGTPKGVASVKAGDIITAGLLVQGREIEEGKIKVTVEDRKQVIFIGAA